MNFMWRTKRAILLARRHYNKVMRDSGQINGLNDWNSLPEMRLIKNIKARLWLLFLFASMEKYESSSSCGVLLMSLSENVSIHWLLNWLRIACSYQPQKPPKKCHAREVVVFFCPVWEFQKNRVFISKEVFCLEHSRCLILCQEMVMRFLKTCWWKQVQLLHFSFWECLLQYSGD